MIYPIKGLNSNTKSEMIRFIRSKELKRNTALYYAIKKGVIMLENYSKNISSDKYDGSYLITFTDGIDNQSMDATLGAPTDGKADPYFQYVKNIIGSKKIKGKKIESHIIAVQGGDVGDNKIFESILEDLASKPDNFILAKNFDEVNANFAKIANDLINKWQNLECYVPPRFKGKVRWTLDDGELYIPPIKKKETVVKKNSKATKFIIINSMIDISPFSLYFSRVKKMGFYLGLGIGSAVYYDDFFNRYEDITTTTIYGGVAMRFGNSNFYGNAGGAFYVRDELNVLLDIGVLYKIKWLSLRTGLGLGGDFSYFSIGAGIAF